MQINFLNYLSCPAVPKGARVLGCWLTGLAFSVAPCPSSSPFLSMSLTYRQCGSGKARRCWGCAPSAAEQRGTPSRCLGSPYAPVHQHGHQPLPTHKVHTILSQPMETLEEEEESKERHETRTEVIPKNSEGQTGFGDSVPGPLQKVLWVEMGRYGTQSFFAWLWTLSFGATNILPPSRLPSAAQRTPCPSLCPRGRQGQRPGCTGPRSGGKP